MCSCGYTLLQIHQLEGNELLSLIRLVKLVGFSRCEARLDQVAKPSSAIVNKLVISCHLCSLLSQQAIPSLSPAHDREPIRTRAGENLRG